VMELAELIEGLPTLWPMPLASESFSDLRDVPTVRELKMVHDVLALYTSFATSLYQAVAAECRPVMRQRRADDPTNLDAGANGGSRAYPSAINSDRVSVGVIGAGQVGRTVVNMLLDTDMIRPEDIVVSTRQPNQFTEITSRTGAWFKVSVGFNNTSCAEHADVLIICVPPASIQNVAKEVSASLRATSLVLSICSGMQCAKVRQIFGTEAATSLSVDGRFVRDHVTKCDEMMVEEDVEKVQWITRENLTQKEATVNEMLYAIARALEGHNFGKEAENDAMAMKGDKEEQEQASLGACYDLLERHFGDVDTALEKFYQQPGLPGILAELAET